MRFPRHAKIFRGQMDAAPLAGVFFLLVIFLLLASLLYTPGVPIQLSKLPANAKVIVITKTGEVVFEHRTYPSNALEQLREVLKTLPAQSKLVVETRGQAPHETLARLRRMAKFVNLPMEIAGAGVQLPSSPNMVNATGPTLVVAVNIAGQLFFENQIVTAEKLRTRFLEAVARSRSPMTLVILGDEGVEYGSIVRLTALAEETGIRQALLQTRPAPLSR